VRTSKGDSKAKDKLALMHVLENEINKVKIQIPLLDLMKYKHFEDPILKLLQTSTENDLMDTINLQDDKPTILMGS